MNLILKWLRFWLFNEAKHRLVREVTRRGVVAYLRVMQGVRHGLMAGLAGFLILQLMTLSLVGAIVTGVFLWDTDFKAKLELLFWIFTGMFSIPAFFLIIVLSERVWFKLSGSQKLVDHLREK